MYSHLCKCSDGWMDDGRMNKNKAKLHLMLSGRAAALKRSASEHQLCAWGRVTRKSDPCIQKRPSARRDKGQRDREAKRQTVGVYCVRRMVRLKRLLPQNGPALQTEPEPLKKEATYVCVLRVINL